MKSPEYQNLQVMHQLAIEELQKEKEKYDRLFADIEHLKSELFNELHTQALLRNEIRDLKHENSRLRTAQHALDREEVQRLAMEIMRITET